MLPTDQQVEIDNPIVEINIDEEENDGYEEQHQTKNDDVATDHDEDDLEIAGSEYSKCNGIKTVLKYSCYLLVVAYLLAAFIIDFQGSIVLFVCTVLVIVWHLWLFYSERNEDKVNRAEQNILQLLDKTDNEYKIAISTILVLIMIIMMFASIDLSQDARNFVSLFGVVVFLGLSWLTSWKPSRVKMRPVIFSVFLQFIFGFIVIRTSWGLAAMKSVGDLFVEILSFTLAGSSFVFSWLTDASLFETPFLLADDKGTYTLGPPFFFSVLPTVIFFSSLMEVGYYLGILPWCVQKIGWCIGLILGTSASESLSVAGNIFVGQTEAPLLGRFDASACFSFHSHLTRNNPFSVSISSATHTIKYNTVRPFMKDMTESELHAVMTGGFATIAGSVFGIYVSFGIDPVAILAASIMSAPAALAVSKITYPETEDSPTAAGKKGSYYIPPSEDANVVHAAANGATVGLTLMLNIAANLIGKFDTFS